MHTDIWTGAAADLATRDEVAVFPVSGWWKSQPIRDQSDAGVDYSLVVSIEAPDTDIDLWAAIAVQVEPGIDVDI